MQFGITSTVVLAAALAGCVSAPLSALREMPLRGSAVSQALAQEYTQFASVEVTEMVDLKDGEYFARKGLKAARGDEPAPEIVSSWQLPVTDVLYLDAPISGGAIKAADGALSIMASGTPEAFDAAAPALDAMAETVFRLGDEAGPGSAMKIVNQLLAGVHIVAAAEAVTFGLSQGIDAQSCYDVISKCAGSSWMFENRVPHILEDDYAPRSAVDIFVKDLGIVSDAARKQKFAAPLASAALDQFVMASGSGLGKEDDAAVAKIYATRAGLALPKK